MASAMATASSAAAAAGLRGDDAVGPQHGDDVVDVEVLVAALDGGRDDGVGAARSMSPTSLTVAAASSASQAP